MIKKWKRFFIALTCAVTIPIVYMYGPGQEPTGIVSLSDFSMTGDFQVVNGIRDSIDTTKFLLPLDSLIDDSVQVYSPGAGDIFCRNIPVDSGKTYRFSIDLKSGGENSNIQFYDGKNTFIVIDSLSPGTVVKEFVAPTNYLQISISYGPSAWANAVLDVEDTTK
jgi:hypothetical protein